MLAGELRPRPRGVSSEREMPARARVLTKDEELGKRDDDFRPASSRASTMSSSLPWNWRRRRVLLAAALIGIVYLFAQHLPTNLASGDIELEGPLVPKISEPRNRFPSHPPASTEVAEEPEDAPPRERDVREDETAQQYYNGPIKFYKLGHSLQNLQMTMGGMENNRNILFAASSLKSLANLIPMACEMARKDQALPHFALFGRSTLTVDELLEINGVNKATCGVYFHDARPDYAQYSSDTRAAISVAGAMIHIHNYMHPQAMIIDHESLENKFFLDAMTMKAGEMGKPLIQLPKGRYEDFMWMTRLDAGSLSKWYTPTIDIVIQAPSGSAGSLIRLLKSLSAAKYDAMPIPRLTVELPSNPEAFVVGYLARMRWPPIDTDLPQLPSLLTVRHRIPSSKITPELASLRFLESFYPNDPNSHHTLVLSPQAEVSPLFMHYLHFSTLKYRHAAYSAPAYEGIIGLSLETRTSLLNGSAFDIPVMANMSLWKSRQEDELKDDAPTPYLYAAPTSSASLIYGDKWVCLHSFLKYRKASLHLGKAKKIEKSVPETEPAWMEYLLELMRARGWSMIYPATNFVTLHNEMAQVPEEFLRHDKDGSNRDTALPDTSDDHEEEAFLVANVPPVLEKHVEKSSKDYGPLHKLLPYKQNMPEAYEMPYYSVEGEILGNTDVTSHAKRFAKNFKTTIGGCTSKEAEENRNVDWLDAKDLFCLPGLEVDIEDDSDMFGGFGGDNNLIEVSPSWQDLDTPEADDDTVDANRSTKSERIAAKDTNAGTSQTGDELEVDLAADTT